MSQREQQVKKLANAPNQTHPCGWQKWPHGRMKGRQGNLWPNCIQASWPEPYFPALNVCSFGSRIFSIPYKKTSSSGMCSSNKEGTMGIETRPGRWCILSDSQLFSVKDQLVNILDFPDLTSSIITTRVCYCSVKSTRDNMKICERGCIPTKLHLWILKFKFHIIFTPHETFFFWFFFKAGDRS